MNRTRWVFSVRVFLSVSLVLLGSLCLFLGCSDQGTTKPTSDYPVVDRQIPAALAGDVSAVVDGNNRFAAELYRAARSQEGNLFLSPYSISTAFAMTYAGARGATAEDMARVFHFDLPQGTLHPAFGALQNSLDRGTSLGGYELRLANRLWGQKGEPFVSSFLDVTRVQYGAEMEAVDFFREAEPLRVHINAWVASKTNDRIQDLLPRGSVSGNTRLVLANAIYFKGTWKTRFDPAKTRPGDFRVSASEHVSVPMMNMHDEVLFAELQNVTLLELPYRGEDLAMLFVLPIRMDGLADVESSLTAEEMSRWPTLLSPVTLDVALPRFEFTYSLPLKDTLVDMDLTSPFGDFADFSGIRSGGGLFISGAFHKAFVHVDEAGTEAAAATGIVSDVTWVPPSFTANHPFLFLIRDKVTGSVLFMGRVADPSK